MSSKIGEQKSFSPPEQQSRVKLFLWYTLLALTSSALLLILRCYTESLAQAIVVTDSSSYTPTWPGAAADNPLLCYYAAGPIAGLFVLSVAATRSRDTVLLRVALPGALIYVLVVGGTLGAWWALRERQGQGSSGGGYWMRFAPGLVFCGGAIWWLARGRRSSSQEAEGDRDGKEESPES